MDCPRCGAPTDGQAECPACGVLVAKAAAAVARRAPRPPKSTGSAQPAPRPVVDSPARSSRPLVVLLVLAALCMVAYSVLQWQPRRQLPPRALSQPVADAAPPPDRGVSPQPELPPEITFNSRPPLVPEPPPPQAFGAGDDGRAVEALASRLSARGRLDAADVTVAERLYTAYPDAGRRLLLAVLAAAAAQERSARRYEQAGHLLERAIGLEPANLELQRALLDLRGEQGDWAGATAVALELQRLGDSTPSTVGALAYALVRQDRTREAIELLAARLERGNDPQLQALLARLQRDSSSETHLRQQTLSHFHVRYDGEAHEEVGRELLRVLERHYATLVRALDHQPSEPIPVLLLSREAYYDGTGAPAWSGGQYDSFDGRVRIPIGGLTTSFAPELEQTALHELTHAFVADRSRGLAPRELQEGLAQLMEGKRLAGLRDDTLRALASGRAGGVGGYYLLSLAFVEDLVAQRGQGGVNDVLAAMARGGNVDAAFRDVYGQEYQAAIAAALTRLRTRYGG